MTTKTKVSQRLAEAAGNGLRLPVSFGSYSGPAGAVLRQGRTEVAFPASWSDFRDGISAGTIDGEPYSVDMAERSEKAKNGPGIKGMIRLTVTAVTE